MTYILSALCVGERAGKEARSGELVAELDEPGFAAVRFGNYEAAGVRYLIVTQDSDGYRSSDELVDVPGGQVLPSRLAIDAKHRQAFATLFHQLSARSPSRELVVYLEANRILSRPDGSEVRPDQYTLARYDSVRQFLGAVVDRAIVEQTVCIVVDKPDASNTPH